MPNIVLRHDANTSTHSFLEIHSRLINIFKPSSDGVIFATILEQYCLNICEHLNNIIVWIWIYIDLLSSNIALNILKKYNAPFELSFL